MRNGLRNMLAAVLVLAGMGNVMAIEEAPYKVDRKDGRFELRQYEAHILAETMVDGDLEEAGNKAFRRLFRYISGDNESRGKIAMTAPVSQSPGGEKIAMTAPVGQQRRQDQWAVSFMMPASFTMETLPQPKDPLVSLRQVPARRLAAVRYSGTWSEERYQRHKRLLEDWIQAQGLVAAGDAEWARYNAPITPWFMRRNEILIPVGAGEQP